MLANIAKIKPIQSAIWTGEQCQFSSTVTRSLLVWWEISSRENYLILGLLSLSLYSSPCILRGKRKSWSKYLFARDRWCI